MINRRGGKKKTEQKKKNKEEPKMTDLGSKKKVKSLH